MADTTYSEPIGESWKYDQEYHRVANFLGLDKYDRDDFELAKKLLYVKGYSEDKYKTKSLEETLLKLNDMRKGLGINTQGRTLVQQLFEYARINTDSKRISQTLSNEALNKQIAEKRESEQKARDKSFVKEKNHMNRSIAKDNQKAENNLNKYVDEYKRSFKPEPKLVIKDVKPVDTRPVPIPLD